MLVKSENHSHFKRIDNVLIEVLSTGEEIPVLSFKQHFIDVQKLNQTTIDYMNRYIEMFPQHVKKVEIIIPEENHEVKVFLGSNKPEDAADVHWYDSTIEGNGKRIEFLETHINQI